MIKYGKSSKILNIFLFLCSTKLLVIRAGMHKMLARIAKGKTLIRLLLQKQSDLGLHYLSRCFWQKTSLGNFRTFTEYTPRGHRLVFPNYNVYQSLKIVFILANSVNHVQCSHLWQLSCVFTVCQSKRFWGFIIRRVKTDLR